MASYLEVKQLLKEIVRATDEINEDNDIVVPTSPNVEGGSTLVLSNDEMKAAFESMQLYTTEKLEMLNSFYREVAIRSLSQMARSPRNVGPVNDEINNITYSLGPASLEYCMFLLNLIAENAKLDGHRAYGDLLMRSRLMLRHMIERSAVETTVNLLPRILRAYTVKIQAGTSMLPERLRDCAASFEFLIMYKMDNAIYEYSDVKDMYSIGYSESYYNREEIDSAPQRFYNAEVLDYYTMAIESRDPFTIYISFYHIIEHYFDAVFRKKLTE